MMPTVLVCRCMASKVTTVSARFILDRISWACGISLVFDSIASLYRHVSESCS